MKKIKWTIFLMASLLIACEKFELIPEENTFFHVKIDGTELPVWVKGNTASQKFILFINGGPGLTSIDVAQADMFGWSQKLEKEFAMVYYDQRGCGNAQGNLDESTLTITQYVKDLNAIVSVLNSQYENPKIFLMGHSFGAFIGVNYLLTDDLQDRIAGWLSIDGAYHFDYDLSWQYRRTFLINIANEEIAKNNNAEHWTQALAWAANNPTILDRDQKNEWRDWIGFPGGIIIPEEVGELTLRDYLSIGFTSSYNPFPSYASANLEIVNDRLNEDAEGINLMGNLETITLPTLMIWGKYDDLIVPEEGQDVFEGLGTSNDHKFFRLFEESSHEPYLSAPDHFQETIIEFVRQY